MDTDLLKEYASLQNKRSELKKELEEVERRSADISGPLLDSMVDAGIDQIKINGRTVYVHQQIWAKIESTKEEVIKALKEADLKEYVSEGYNSQSLSAYVRNQIESGELLPKELNGHVSAVNKVSVRSTKA